MPVLYFFISKTVNHVPAQCVKYVTTLNILTARVVHIRFSSLTTPAQHSVNYQLSIATERANLRHISDLMMLVKSYPL